LIEIDGQNPDEDDRCGLQRHLDANGNKQPVPNTGPVGSLAYVVHDSRDQPNGRLYHGQAGDEPAAFRDPGKLLAASRTTGKMFPNAC
jgi:hypothetical protein